jgi:hypothetical protein
MRCRLLTLSIALIGFNGCKSTAPAASPEAPNSPSTNSTGRSLADMEAEYAALRKKYVADCIDGTPDHIRNNQPMCNQERATMAPLGRALTEAELKAAAKATQNP